MLLFLILESTFYIKLRNNFLSIFAILGLKSLLQSTTSTWTDQSPKIASIEELLFSPTSDHAETFFMRSFVDFIC